MELDEMDGNTISDGVTAVDAIGRALRARTAGLQGTLDAILLAATDCIELVDFAGVNILRGRSFEPQAALGEPPNELDVIQQRTGEGPCIEASRSQLPIVVDDLARDPRWPDFTARGIVLGVRSMLCVPLWVDEHRLGSVSLYSTTPNAFGERAQRVAELLAVHAAVVLSDAQRIDNLGLALKNRDLIGQAKGILMERHRITADVAFTLLSTASQRSNRKVASVAEEVASTGVLPS
ncbi:GAF and ANTAR domain-containing protein [uncultured Jatrophihabitans sp.]|uniref:GAF and ANTAR domain-containing protein n=1 Tax=uncultured Jatrophihabitans sp. TaxID=1610747 RepID=UPI0035C9B7AE